jgi:hypothetical protein
MLDAVFSPGKTAGKTFFVEKIGRDEMHHYLVNFV